MAIKPVDQKVDFAETAAASRVATEAQVDVIRDAGYPVRFRPPSGIWNRILRSIGRWIDWLARSSGGYSAPQAGTIGTFPVGTLDTLITGASGPGIGISAVLDTTDNTGDFATTMDHDGQFVIYVEQGDGVAEAQCFVLDPSFSFAGGTRKFNLGFTSGDVAAVAANGTYIAIGRTGGAVEVWDYDGNSQFTFNTNSGTLVDLAMDNDRVYAAGAAGIATPGGTNAREVHAYTLSTGAFAWEMDAAKATINSIRTDGDFVYIAGAVFGGDHLWRLIASSGVTDAAGSTTDPPVGRKQLALAQDSLYVVTRNGGVDTLREFNKNHISPAGTFNQISSVSLVVNNQGPVDADDRYVYVHDGTRMHGIPVGRELSDKYAGWNIVCDAEFHVTSGQYLYFIDNTIGPPRQLRFVTLDRRPGVWQYFGANPPARHWFRRRFIPGD